MKQKLTNEEKFMKEVGKTIIRLLKKYKLKNALLLLPDDTGHYKFRVNKPMTEEQLKTLPRA